MATFGGAELGCACALKVFEILNRPETKKNIDFISDYLRKGLDKIREENPDILPVSASAVRSWDWNLREKKAQYRLCSTCIRTEYGRSIRSLIRMYCSLSLEFLQVRSIAMNCLRKWKRESGKQGKIFWHRHRRIRDGI